MTEVPLHLLDGETGDAMKSGLVCGVDGCVIDGFEEEVEHDAQINQNINADELRRINVETKS